MQIVDIDIRETVEASWNYKHDDDVTQMKLLNNIIEDGILSLPVVRINEDGHKEVCDGNHRRGVIINILSIVDNPHNQEEQNIREKYLAKGHNFSKIPCIFLGEIPLIQAKKIAVKLNETRFSNDAELLSDILLELNEEYGETMFQELPFNFEEFVALTDSGSTQTNGEASDFEGSLEKDMKNMANETKFDEPLKTINIVVPESTYNLWTTCKSKLATLAITSDARCMELILVEFDNIPLETLDV